MVRFHAMTARILDGKALAETVRAEVRAGVEAFQERSRPGPGARRRPRRRGPGERRLHAQQGEGLERGRHARAGFTGCRWRRRRPISCAARPAQRRPRRRRHPRPAPAPEAHRRAARARLIDPAKDVDGFHPINAGLARPRPCRRARRVHAVRVHAPARAGRREARRGQRRRRRAEQHRRQAHGAAPARRATPR